MGYLIAFLIASNVSLALFLVRVWTDQDDINCYLRGLSDRLDDLQRGIGDLKSIKISQENMQRYCEHCDGFHGPGECGRGESLTLSSGGLLRTTGRGGLTDPVANEGLGPK
jgi:hypothetical protein